jgi:hypothetical protein
MKNPDFKSRDKQSVMDRLNAFCFKHRYQPLNGGLPVLFLVFVKS